MGKFPTKAVLTRRIGLISWPYALCLASRDARQAPNSIFAEKTSIQRRGKRPSFPRTANPPRETRVAKKPRHSWGVNECPALLMPFQCLSRAFLTPQAPHRACPRDACPAQETAKTRYLPSSMTGMPYPSPSDHRDGKSPTRGKRGERTRRQRLSGRVSRVTRAQDPFFAPETIARRCGDHPSSIRMEDPPRITRDARKRIAGRWGKWIRAPFAPLSVPTLRIIRREARATPLWLSSLSGIPILRSPPSCEEGIAEDRESVYTTLRVRIRVYARARLLQRERELFIKSLL